MLCPFHEEISMELCFEKQEDQDMRYQWSNCHCLDIKTSFQGLPKFNLKPAMVERNPILLTNLIPFERSLLPQGLLYLGWDPKFSCKYFLFGEKEWPSRRTTLHVWSKGDILDLSSWEAQCTTAASYIFAK